MTLTFFAAGLVAGDLSVLPISTSTAGMLSNLLLQILIALVGIATGSNPRLGSILRGIRPTIVAVPVVALVATVAAGCLAGWLLLWVAPMAVWL